MQCETISFYMKMHFLHSKIANTKLLFLSTIINYQRLMVFNLSLIQINCSPITPDTHN